MPEERQNSRPQAGEQIAADLVKPAGPAAADGADGTARHSGRGVDAQAKPRSGDAKPDAALADAALADDMPAARVAALARGMAAALDHSTETVRAFMSLPAAVGDLPNDLQHGINGMIAGVVATNLRATQQLLSLTNPNAVIELQQQFIREYLDVMLEGGASFIRAARKSADQSMRPLEEYIAQRRQAMPRQPPAG